MCLPGLELLDLALKFANQRLLVLEPAGDGMEFGLLPEENKQNLDGNFLNSRFLNFSRVFHYS